MSFSISDTRNLSLGFIAASALLSTAALFLVHRNNVRVGGSTESFGSKKGGGGGGGGGSDGDGRGGARLVVVHARWCGHCTELMRDGGVWSQVKRRLPGVPVEDIDEARNPGAVKRLGVTSYPSIHVVDEDGNSVAQFQDKRSADAVVDFALANIRTAA